VPLGHTALPAHWVFVVAASGVHAAKAGSARGRFNRASLACRALLDCWNRGADPPAPSLAAALSPPGALEALTVRATSAPPDGFSAGELQRRLAHFVAEDRRVPQAAAACRAADRAAISHLAEGSQLDADTLLGNQVPETAALAALARACGAFAATSFGAGFGGSVWALVDRHDVDAVVRDWKAAYARRFPACARWQSFIACPGPAVTAIPIVDGRAAVSE
jgi:galactokinase